jgi:hypothetical protein
LQVRVREWSRQVALLIAIALYQGGAGVAQDTVPPQVTGVTPAAGSTITVVPGSIAITFDEALDPASIDARTVRVVRSGGDGTFSDGNEVEVVPAGVSLATPTSLSIDLTGVTLPLDRYKVILSAYNAGTALAFDGSDDFAAAPQWLSGTGTTFTMECWARALGSGSSDGNTIIHRADFNDSYLAWAVATNTHECSISLNEKATSLTETFFFGIWYHVAGTYDGATVRLYINGNLVGSHAIAKTINWDLGYFGSYIGGNGRDPFNKFNGQLDEVRIWNVARSQTEIQASMKRRLTGTETGLMGYYRLDEGTGQIINDLSPAARHGILGSSAAAEGDDPGWVVSTAPVSGVSDVAGNALDGEFTMTFPSGNGSAGGDFSSTFDLAAPAPPPPPPPPAPVDMVVGGGCGLIGVEGFIVLAPLLLLSRLRRRVFRSRR